MSFFDVFYVELQKIVEPSNQRVQITINCILCSLHQTGYQAQVGLKMYGIVNVVLNAESFFTNISRFVWEMLLYSLTFFQFVLSEIINRIQFVLSKLLKLINRIPIQNFLS